MFGHIEVITAFERNTIAEFFYYVKYGSTIITSKYLSNENINTGVSVTSFFNFH